VAALGKHFPTSCWTGELVVAGPGGRLDFMAPTRPLAGGRGMHGPASYVVFDALSAVCGRRSC
jgi:hypothetical protein